jgi:osmotically-inducible protein OsmY
VTLDGAVDAFWKKLRAEALASNVSGAVSIDNQLNVIRAKDFIDQDIGEAITEALERNALVEAQDVDVIVEDGVVTLAGTVPTRTARQAAYNAARYTLGVVDVHNNLLVE